MLELVPSLMLIVLLLFIGLIVYLNRALYQPIVNFMDQREATIARDRQESLGLTNSAQELEKQAQEILDSAKQEANALKHEARTKAEEEALAVIGSKEAELEKAYSDFIQKLESEREELRNGILSQVPLIKEALKAKFSKL
jgi:F-type H+-transporting ATPase subunit b